MAMGEKGDEKSEGVGKFTARISVSFHGEAEVDVVDGVVHVRPRTLSGPFGPQWLSARDGSDYLATPEAAKLIMPMVLREMLALLTLHIEEQLSEYAMEHITLPTKTEFKS